MLDMVKREERREKREEKRRSMLVSGAGSGVRCEPDCFALR
jgi:hypothetical protein